MHTATASRGFEISVIYTALSSKLFKIKILVTVLNFMGLGGAFISHVVLLQGKQKIMFCKSIADQLKRLGKRSAELNDFSSAAMYYEEFCKRKPTDYKVIYQLAKVIVWQRSTGVLRMHTSKLIT